MNPVLLSSGMIFAGMTLLWTVGACSKDVAVDSTPQWLASPGMTDAEIQKALKATMALRVNLTSNRATLYRKGEALQQWNIASADVTGRYHGGQPKYTPEGIYGVEDFEHCPAWRPVDPVNPATGRIAQSEDERWQIFNTYPEVYGPCGERNPLGRYVIWFQGPFGLHGNAAEDILRLRDPDDRRVSGGCLRNPNAKIREIFHLALDLYPEMMGFKSRVIAMEANPNKSTVSQSVRNLDMRIVVGSWNSDPLVSTPDGGGTEPPAPVPTATPIPEPIGPAMICKAIAIDPARGIAPVHITLPATNENVSAWYRLSDPVRVQGLIPGTTFYRTGRGYIDKKYIGNCSNL